MKFPTLLTLIAGLGAASVLHADEKIYLTRDNPNAATDRYEGRYLQPYQSPRADEIRQTLAAVLASVERAGAPKLVHRGTEQEITDLAQPADDAVLASSKFPLLAYPTAVLYGSLLLAAETTGDKHYADYVTSRYQFVADHLAYFEALGKKAGNYNGNPFRHLYTPGHLDGCGALGAAFIKANRAGLGPDFRPIIDRFAAHVSHGQFRLSDGTLARRDPHPESLWADDLYMAVPLLAQLGALTGDRTYFDDAVKQVTQFAARMFNPQLGVFAHGWSTATAEMNPEFYWGRANGWCLMAMCELLEVLPQDHPGRPAVLKILRAHIQGLARLQDQTGLWHQLLNRPDSYLETSCSAMFTFGIARAINRGWVPAESFGPIAQAGWNGVLTKISPEGNVTDICVGTNYAGDYIYYYSRPKGDDAHGYGPVIFAGAEMLRLVTNPHVEIKYSGRTYIYSTKP